MSDYAAAMSIGGHLAAIHAAPDGHIALSFLSPEIYPTSGEARRLAAELLIAAEVADEPPTGRDQRPETD